MGSGSTARRRSGSERTAPEPPPAPAISGPSLLRGMVLDDGVLRIPAPRIGELVKEWIGRKAAVESRDGSFRFHLDDAADVSTTITPSLTESGSIRLAFSDTTWRWFIFGGSLSSREVRDRFAAEINKKLEASDKKRAKHGGSGSVRPPLPEQIGRTLRRDGDDAVVFDLPLPPGIRIGHFRLDPGGLEVDLRLDDGIPTAIASLPEPAETTPKVMPLVDPPRPAGGPAGGSFLAIGDLGRCLNAANKLRAA